MMIPDPSERTVRIPVQWIDGQWQLVGGGRLPELAPNAYADLVLPAMFLADEQQRQRWTQEFVLDFLKAKTELYARVNVDKIPKQLEREVEPRKDDKGNHCSVVKIVLLEDVRLALVPGKKGRLVGGQAAITIT